MNEKLEELIRAICKSLLSGDDVDKDYMFYGDHIYTKREIAKNIQEQTEIGVGMLDMIMCHSLSQIARGQII